MPSEETTYLDHAATTPLRAEVRAAMLPLLEGVHGNPSSAHAAGRAARAALEDARARLAAVVGAQPAEVVFTRGGTESDNLAVLGRARVARGRPVVCSAIEHKAVLAAADAAARESGAPLHVLPVDVDGRVSAAALEDALRERPAVVSVMWANNEVGVLQEIESLAGLCAEAGVAFHSDAVQALGKVPVRVDQVPAALLSFTGHKLGGPRGVGALYVRRGTELAPLLYGGGQERGLRPGTEDVAGAVGLAVAAELAETEREEQMRRLGALRDRMEAALRERVPGLSVNAAGAPRLATVSSLVIPGVEGELLMAALDLEGIAASTGSACSSGAVARSHVLAALGLPEESGAVVRLSLWRDTTERDVERAVEVLAGIVGRWGG